MKRVGHHIELTGKEARQGQIILNTPLRIAVFMGGLVGLVVLAILLGGTA
jgi:hypothetical protein